MLTIIFWILGQESRQRGVSWWDFQAHRRGILGAFGSPEKTDIRSVWQRGPRKWRLWWWCTGWIRGLVGLLLRLWWCSRWFTLQLQAGWWDFQKFLRRPWPLRGLLQRRPLRRLPSNGWWPAIEQYKQRRLVIAAARPWPLRNVWGRWWLFRWRRFRWWVRRRQ